MKDQGYHNSMSYNIHVHAWSAICDMAQSTENTVFIIIEFDAVMNIGHSKLIGSMVVFIHHLLSEWETEYVVEHRASWDRLEINKPAAFQTAIYN